MSFTVAVTGASGAIYGLRTVAWLLAGGQDVDLVVSPSGARVMAEELGVALDPDHPSEAPLAEWLPGGPSAPPGPGGGRLVLHPAADVGARIASGSFPSRGMVVAPCSMGTAARIAAGLSDNLVQRAADVCLKERRPLVLAVRESPLSVIHLENLLRLARAGATILPPVPAFYQAPRSIEEMVDHTVARILLALGAPPPDHFRPWSGRMPSPSPENGGKGR